MTCVMMETDMKPRSARRCLFGRPSPGENLSNLIEQDRQMNEPNIKRFREKYGFDVVAGVPIAGGEHELEPVDLRTEYIPSFYTRGYPPTRKSRHVSRLNRERSPPSFVFNRQRVGLPTKRKLILCEDDIEPYKVAMTTEQENDENKRIPYVDSPSDRSESSAASPRQQTSLSSSPSSMPEFIDKSTDTLCLSAVIGSVCGLGLTRSSSTSSLAELSPCPHNTDHTPPMPSRSKSLTQSSITDFLQVKKQRCHSKSLPRT